MLPHANNDTLINYLPNSPLIILSNTSYKPLPLIKLRPIRQVGETKKP